eukprot:2574059-Amphidinium_carterae.1
MESLHEMRLSRLHVAGAFMSHDSVLSHVCGRPDFVHPDVMPLAEAPLRLRRQAVGLQQSRCKFPQPVPEFKRIVNLPKYKATPMMMKCLSLTVRGGIDEKGLGPIATEDAVDSGPITIEDAVEPYYHEKKREQFQ